MKKKQKPTLLVVSPFCPYPAESGGKIRVFHILKELSQRFSITVLALAEPNDNIAEARTGLDFIEHLITIPIRSGRTWQFLRLLRNLPQWLTGTPAEISIKYSPELLKECRHLAAKGHFDCVQLELPHFIQYAPPFLAAGIPTILVSHDISYVTQWRRASIAQGPTRRIWEREARLMETYERRAWPRFNSIIAMSEVDRQEILRYSGGTPVQVVPNGVDTHRLQIHDEGKTPTLIFVGWTRHAPNRDGLQWFLDTIWPDIRQAHATARFVVISRSLPQDLYERVSNDPRIDYLADIEDAYPAVGKSWVSIVPLRIGSGTRLKILEAMAVGTPVVSTSVGCEGIATHDGEGIIIADTPKEFRNAVLTMLNDHSARAKISVNARRVVEEQYDWMVIGAAAADAVTAAIRHKAR